MSKLSYRYDEGAFADAMQSKYGVAARASTGAMNDAAVIIKSKARANIAAAGFSTRFQNAMRVDVFPKRGKVSIDAAALAFHKVPYAEVFEAGATIRGRPMLFIPLPNAPKKIGGERITPRLFEQRIGPLHFIKRTGKPPLLAANAQMTRGMAAQESPKLSLSALRRGAGGGAPGRGKRQLITRSVPLFVGLPAVTVKKRLAIRQVCEQVRGQLGALYLQNFKGE